MYIDSHVHFWKYNDHEYSWIDDSMAVLHRDFMPGELKLHLDSNNISGCIAVQVRQSEHETQWFLDLAAQNPFILGVVGWVDLRSPDVAHQLEKFRTNPKLVGIRHIVQSEQDSFLLDPAFLRGIALLQDFDLTYDILIYPRQLPTAIRFVEKFPNHRFVLDHLAKPPVRSREITEWAKGIRELAQFPNLFCKLSGLVTEGDLSASGIEQFIPYLQIAFDAFEPDRLMIGSDWPVCTAAARYEVALDATRTFLHRYSAETQAIVMGTTAHRFWKLPQRRET
jgi:L-fuconolactonase